MRSAGRIAIPIAYRVRSSSGDSSHTITLKHFGRWHGENDTREPNDVSAMASGNGRSARLTTRTAQNLSDPARHHPSALCTEPSHDRDPARWRTADWCTRGCVPGLNSCPCASRRALRGVHTRDKPCTDHSGAIDLHRILRLSFSCWHLSRVDNETLSLHCRERCGRQSAVMNDRP